MSEAQSYDHDWIEKKWQALWEKEKPFRAKDGSMKPHYFALDMFPYPSGSGLHVGHPEGYTATDIISRYKRMRGFEVLHPMGFDAFGLPAENYAIKTKIHPEKSTLDNIQVFRRQLKALGFSYDWDREVSTCLPDYYMWTQWFFAFLYKNGLAYRKEAPVNWCDDCQTVLANEQVVEGKCERCGNQVLAKYMSQWFFRITDFIENTKRDEKGNDKALNTSGLLSGLDKIDWPESTKIAQRNWIGRSEGVNYLMKVKDLGFEVEAYDSIPQTYMAQTFTIIAPEHPLVADLVRGTPYEKPVMNFVEKVKKLKMTKKFDITTDMQGIFTGRFIENPFGTGDLPLWISSFVVMDYGTGIVNCSACDERDFAFAKKYAIPLRPVMVPEDESVAAKVLAAEICWHHDENGILLEPNEFKGRRWGEVREDIIEHLVNNGIARRKVNYKMRDWLVSRQRYWGAPIPIVYDDEGKEYLVPEGEYPVKLPTDVDFMPKGESPLTKSDSFHAKKDLERIEKKLKKAGVMSKGRTLVRRESDTMDTFVCSSWYMWRFMNPHNKKEFASRKLMEEWGPVDLYVGGAEHTVLHLLYARFFCKALHRFGYISYDEPFTKLRHQGIILGEDGEKMSKSKGNVINPDSIVKEFGADTLRLYEMFMGPFKDMIPWSSQGVKGVYRFLVKTWGVVTGAKLTDEKPDGETLKLMHQTIKKVTKDIEEFKFNTAISQMMIFTNHLAVVYEKVRKENEMANLGCEGVPRVAVEALLMCLYPFAPHMAEEAWSRLKIKEKREKMIAEMEWPTFDEELCKESEIEMAVQVNGKLRTTMRVSADISKELALEMARGLSAVKKYLVGGTVKKEVFVPGKIVNFVMEV